MTLPPRRLAPRPGLSAPIVRSIPDGPLTGEWFRQFITNHLNPYALQGTQGQTTTQSTTPQTPPFTTKVNSPLNATTMLTNVVTQPSTVGMWAPAQQVHIPDAVAFDVDANGGIVDLLFGTSGTWGNGYIIRFDGRNGEIAGQILKFTAGSWNNIGTAVAAPNSAALSGTYRVVALMGLNGKMSVYVDGELQTKAVDTTYTLDGSTYLAIEVATSAKLWVPSAIDGTLDYVADGFEFVHLAADHAAGNVAYNFRGVWASANSYVQGDEVVYGQNYWLALQASQASTPGTGNAAWQVVGSYSAYQGAWSASANYVVGDEVTYSGNYWIAIAASTNSAPSLTNANWQVAGPQTLDDLANGTTYQKTLASALQSGTIRGVTQGLNMVRNGGFELHSVGLGPLVYNAVVGSPLCDGWDISIGSQSDIGSGMQNGIFVGYLDEAPASGTYNCTIIVPIGTVIPSDGVYHSLSALSDPFVVMPGAPIYASYALQFDSAHPTTYFNSVIARFMLGYFDATGTPLTNQWLFNDVTSQSSTYNSYTLSGNVPSTAAYAQVWCVMYASSTTGGTTTTSEAVGRFDNVYVTQQAQTSDIAEHAVSNYAITEAPNGGSYTTPTADGTYNVDLETVANTTAGGWVEVTGTTYATLQPPNGSGTTMNVAFVLTRDGTTVGSGQFGLAGGQGASPSSFVYLSCVDTPPAGSHTYALHATITIQNLSGAYAGVLVWGASTVKMREFKR